MYWGFTFPNRFTFNTRSESVLKPGLWNNSFEERRCIVPADSFFKWKRLHKKNNPKYEIFVKGREPFALAGIWSTWKNKDRGFTAHRLNRHVRAQQKFYRKFESLTLRHVLVSCSR